MRHEERIRFWKGRSVAMTGATGFVGHHLASLLRECGANVTALVRAKSACDRLRSLDVHCKTAALDDIDSLARGCDGAEYLFHLAGAVDFENDWERFRLVNVQGTRNVIAAARRAGINRMVHTSSIVAVGANQRPFPLNETSTWNLRQCRVPYVTTKRQGEELALQSSDGGLQVVVVNPACVIGPDDFSKSEFGTLCYRFWRGRIPFHFGGGHNFVDVRDVALGHLLAAERGRPGERYILGGVNRTLTSFFGDLARVADRAIFRMRLPRGVGSVVAKFADRVRKKGRRSYLTASQSRLLSLFFFYDCRKANRELGYQPRDFAETTRETHRFWMQKNAA